VLEAGEPKLERAAVDGFLSAIHDRYGYDLRGYAPASIQRRVETALRRSGLSTLGELARHAVAEPAFFADVLDSLTVTVSEMFRDPPLYRVLRTRVVPRLKTYARVNVWVSGCAMGEEAYSIAILLDEEGLLDRCQIYATDLNPRAIARAKEGLFPVSAWAAFVANYEAAGGTADPARYYTGGYGRMAMHAFLGRHISFFQHDLVADHIFGEMDLILCRNVLIYFGRELKQRVCRKLSDGLRPGGLLVLGSSEQLPSTVRATFGDLAREQRIYRKELGR
jgi:chemotaxis protein methyltransferase CheR